MTAAIARAEALATAVADLRTELNRADRAVADQLGVGGAEDLQLMRLLHAEGPLRVGDLARSRSLRLSALLARATGGVRSPKPCYRRCSAPR